MEKGSVDLHFSFYEDEEDGGWIGACPEIGVYTQGETRDEAAANLQEAMEAWFLDCLEHGDLEWALRECGLQPQRISQIKAFAHAFIPKEHKVCHA